MNKPKAKKSEDKFKDMSLAEAAYHQIKEEILKNKFPSGEFISISDLSESLEGMGRTPVREAVQRLHDERLLIVVPRKGIIIPEFDIKKMMDQLELRFVLEKYATLKVADRITPDTLSEAEQIMHRMESSEGLSAYQLAKLNLAFHMKLIEDINNQEIIQTLNRIYDHHIRIYTYFLDNKMRLTVTQAEHREILASLREGDAARVEKATDVHYESTRRELLDSLMT